MKLTIELDAQEVRKTIETGTLLRLVDVCLEDLGAVKAVTTTPEQEPKVVELPQFQNAPPQQQVLPQQHYAPPVQEQMQYQAPPQQPQYQQPPQEQMQYQAPPQQYQQPVQPVQQTYQAPPQQYQRQPETAQQMQYPQNQQLYPQNQQAPPQQTAPQANAPGPEDIRAVLAPAMKAGAIDRIDALWAKFGVTKLSDLQPHQYADAYAEAQILAAQVGVAQ